MKTKKPSSRERREAAMPAKGCAPVCPHGIAHTIEHIIGDDYVRTCECCHMVDLGSIFDDTYDPHYQSRCGDCSR